MKPLIDESTNNFGRACGTEEQYFSRLGMFYCRLRDIDIYTSPSSEITVSQWNFGKNMHSWPAPRFIFSFWQDMLSQ